MLRCLNLSVHPPGDPSAPPLLDHVNASFRPGAMNAIIGPSGSGKTMLVKGMLGLIHTDPGSEVWLGAERVTKPEDLLGRVGFAPQFSIAQPKLTVNECLSYTLQLTVNKSRVREERLERILNVIGLGEHRHKRVESLSGGQLRRLGLGLELTVDPPTLICDEVTSGLDPMSEDTILDLLHMLSRERGKTLLCIIHNLAKLDYFDWITVVNVGHVVFQGTLESMHEYFGIPDALHLYDALKSQTNEHWAERWAREGLDAPTVPPPASADPAEKSRPVTSRGEAVYLDTEVRVPDAASQFFTLLLRRAHLFFRDYGYLALVLGITFGFPVLVVIFALDGLPQISTPILDSDIISPTAFQSRVSYSVEAAQSATLVTSLIMFQVILLTLMGANNGAREIASERLLYEKERLFGVSPEAYAMSKLVFTGLLAAFQGAWMTFFVDLICQFPGSGIIQVVALISSCVAMTWVCLAFSAWMNSPERSYTLAIYLVGFQLPLSGVVLALPSYLVWVFRPFINAYWGWAGYFSSMEKDRLYDAYTTTNKDAVVASAAIALIVLGIHALCGVMGVWSGCRQRRWNA